MEGRVRRASLADAERIAAIHVAARGASLNPSVGAGEVAAFTEAQALEEARARLGKPPTPDHRSWSLTLGDDVRGFCFTGPSRDEDADITATTEVYACCIEPGFTERGLGRTALVWSVDDLRDRGYHDVTVWVPSADRRARAFAEAGGFRIDGPPKLRDDHGASYDALRYRLSLRG